MISETKLYCSFPEAQFYMESYSQTFRLDRTDEGGGIMLYVWEEIPSKLIQLAYCKPDTEYFLVNVNLRRKKWLLVCSYNCHKTLARDSLDCIIKEIDSLSTKYKTNILLLGDFKSKPTEEAMTTFC